MRTDIFKCLQFLSLSLSFFFPLTWMLRPTSSLLSDLSEPEEMENVIGSFQGALGCLQGCVEAILYSLASSR